MPVLKIPNRFFQHIPRPTGDNRLFHGWNNRGLKFLGTPGGGWRKILLRGVLTSGVLSGDENTPGGGWICLSVTGCVTGQTFVEIEGKSFFLNPKSFFQSLPNLLLNRSGENEGG